MAEVHDHDEDPGLQWQVDGEAPDWKETLPKRAKQAKIPKLIGVRGRGDRGNVDEKADLVWKAPSWMSEDEIADFVKTAGELFVEEDIALEILKNNDYDIEEGLIDVEEWSGQSPHVNWTEKEKGRFARLFMVYGKCFNKIKSGFADKSVSDVLVFYYNWKGSDEEGRVVYLTKKREVQRKRKNLKKWKI